MKVFHLASLSTSNTEMLKEDAKSKRGSLCCLSLATGIITAGRSSSQSWALWAIDHKEEGYGNSAQVAIQATLNTANKKNPEDRVCRSLHSEPLSYPCSPP